MAAAGMSERGPVIVGHLRAESDRLIGRLQRLPADGWRRPTRCAGWQVIDIAPHLNGGAERQVAALQRGLRGDVSAGSDEEDELDAAGARSGPQVLAHLERNMGALIDTFASFGPEDWQKSAWHKTGVHAMPWFLVQRLGELSIHRSDVVDALGEPPDFSDEVASAILEQYVARLPRLLNGESAASLQATVELFSTGERPVSYTLDIDHDRAVLREGRAGEPGLSIKGAPSALVLLATGRSVPTASAELDISGDLSLAKRWPALFRPL
jgi:uncharacterized protein (TIGR03083 family)